MAPRILITGNVGVSLPPPYVGIPKLSLLSARAWREAGAAVAVTWLRHEQQEDDMGAGAEYFFEYQRPPGKLAKLFFLLRYFLKNPALYAKLFRAALSSGQKFTREAVLYSAFGVFLDEICKKFKPSVILAEAALIKSFMAVHVGRLRHIPVVLDTYAEVHDLSMGVNKYLNDEERKKYWDAYLGAAALVIAPSFYCAKGPLTYVPSERVKVVYPGIDLTLFAKPIVTQEARTYFKLPTDEFLVCAVGAFTPRKGHDHLIQAAGKLNREGHPVHVALCGPGDPAPWRKLAEKEGISDKVHLFTGLSEVELTTLYYAIDLYVDASNTPRACLGMSLTEAMAAGKPAVAYNHGGLPEVVRHGENGLLSPVNDIDGLARAILEVYKMPEAARRTMGEKGNKLVHELVDLSIMAKNKLAILGVATKQTVAAATKP